MREKDYADKLDPVDLSFYGLTLLRNELGQLNIAVDKDNGGQPLEHVVEVDEKNRTKPSILTFGHLYKSGRFKPQRNYKPFWKNLDEFSETDL